MNDAVFAIFLQPGAYFLQRDNYCSTAIFCLSIFLVLQNIFFYRFLLTTVGHEGYWGSLFCRIGPELWVNIKLGTVPNMQILLITYTSSVVDHSSCMIYVPVLCYGMIMIHISLFSRKISSGLSIRFKVLEMIILRKALWTVKEWLKRSMRNGKK